jgi:prepilin peptidase CpaA
MTGLADIALWPVAAVALWAAAVDALYMRIPNAVHVALLAVFAILVLPGLPWQETLLRLAIGAVMFAIGFGLYAANMLGAGDVKYLAAAAPLLPPDPAIILVWLLLVTMAGLPVLVLHRLARLLPGTGRFPSFAEAGYFPYGPAISIGLVCILWLTGGPG